MHSAAVGFQCPQCVSAGLAATRSATAPLGGRMVQRPRVSMALIVVNLAIFGVALLLGTSRQIIAQYGMWPVGIAIEGERHSRLALGTGYGLALRGRGSNQRIDDVSCSTRRRLYTRGKYWSFPHKGSRSR